jgi:signal transduction histidine kinase
MEALTIADVLGVRIAAAFDRAAALAANAKAMASEQRLRLARDLHDGILQFLAGSAMQLESIISAGDNSAERLDRLRALQDALKAEQRELRTFIRRLRPGSAQPPSGEIALQPDLTALVERLESQWRVNIYLSVNPPGLLVPATLHYDIHQFVREGVANAVRHGQSRWINIAANSEGELLYLTIADDGCGLGHHGTFQARQLVELGIGPRSLRERVQSLGGTITVTSASLGTLVCLSVPLKGLGGRGA